MKIIRTAKMGRSETAESNHKWTKMKHSRYTSWAEIGDLEKFKWAGAEKKKTGNVPDAEETALEELMEDTAGQVKL